MKDDMISRQAALDIYDDYNIAVENGELESYRRYRKQMLALPPTERWIPCSEEMPQKKGRYIVTVRNIFDNIEVRFRYWNADCNLWSGDQMDEVLAWCEIPEPWEDKKAEGAATPRGVIRGIGEHPKE